MMLPAFPKNIILFPKNVVMLPKGSADMTDIRFISTKEATKFWN